MKLQNQYRKSNIRLLKSFREKKQKTENVKKAKEIIFKNSYL